MTRCDLNTEIPKINIANLGIVASASAKSVDAKSCSHDGDEAAFGGRGKGGGTHLFPPPLTNDRNCSGLHDLGQACMHVPALVITAPPFIAGCRGGADYDYLDGKMVYELDKEEKAALLRVRADSVTEERFLCCACVRACGGGGGARD